jgi:gentisate 1,2-dioxygenase
MAPAISEHETEHQVLTVEEMSASPRKKGSTEDSAEVEVNVDSKRKRVESPSKSNKQANTPLKYRPPFSLKEGEVLPEAESTSRESELTGEGRIYEYTSAANPPMAAIPILSYPAELHETGETRVIQLDLKDHIQVPYSATSPNLLASYVRIVKGEKIQTRARATSQAFYIIQGKGKSDCGVHGVIPWATGDMVVIPRCPGPILHSAESTHDCSIYWVSDEPLLRYLGVMPSEDIFQPTVIRRETMLKEFEKLTHQPGVEHPNRMGILLGNTVTAARRPPAVPGDEPAVFPEAPSSGTLTLTPTLWSLLNMLPPKDDQMPHRHNSVALDLCVFAPPEEDGENGKKLGVYTNMGPELGEDGMVKDPIRCDWKSGSAFITPPGWWHSHHNETGEPAWVLPIQDAGLYTYQRTLDIRFSQRPTTTPDKK